MCVAGGTKIPMKLVIKEKCNYVCRVTTSIYTHHWHSVYMYISYVTAVKYVSAINHEAEGAQRPRASDLLRENVT